MDRILISDERRLRTVLFANAAFYDQGGRIERYPSATP
jgi:hypothetical protein